MFEITVQTEIAEQSGRQIDSMKIFIHEKG